MEVVVVVVVVVVVGGGGGEVWWGGGGEVMSGGVVEDGADEVNEMKMRGVVVVVGVVEKWWQWGSGDGREKWRSGVCGGGVEVVVEVVVVEVVVVVVVVVVEVVGGSGGVCGGDDYSAPFDVKWWGSCCEVEGSSWKRYTTRYGSVQNLLNGSCGSNIQYGSSCDVNPSNRVNSINKRRLSFSNINSFVFLTIKLNLSYLFFVLICNNTYLSPFSYIL